MKNKKIIDAWNKIELDAAADARMLEAIIAHNQSKTRKVYPMNKTFKRLVPIAACLALAIAAAVVIPHFTAQQPIAPTRPTQTQNAPVKLEQMSLPVMLAGQEVKWQNLAVKDTEPKEDDASWYVTVFGADGLELHFGSPDTKPVGTLADGRKVILATEEIRREESGEKNAANVTITLGAYDAIEVGTTIMEFSHSDETGLTVVYRCYIEAIE